MNKTTVVPFRGLISRKDREYFFHQKAKVFWLTGLSSSGKSTIAHGLEYALFNKGYFSYVFDGDNVRQGLCADLSFSPEGRSENLRRISEMIKLFLDAGVVCLTAFISPLLADRAKVKSIVGFDNFFEVFISCPVDECEKRDPKGLYALARKGKIANYTGISAPYEPPSNPDLVIKTDVTSVDESIRMLYEFVVSKVSPD